MENVAKPITIVREDFINNVIELVNTSQLPLFIVEYVLRDILNEVHGTVVKQLQADKDRYAAAIKEKADAEQKTTETED